MVKTTTKVYKKGSKKYKKFTTSSSTTTTFPYDYVDHTGDALWLNENYYRSEKVSFFIVLVLSWVVILTFVIIMIIIGEFNG